MDATIVTTPFIIVPVRLGVPNDREWNDYTPELLSAEHAEWWKALPWSPKQGRFVTGGRNYKRFKTREEAEHFASVWARLMR